MRFSRVWIVLSIMSCFCWAQSQASKPSSSKFEFKFGFYSTCDPNFVEESKTNIDEAMGYVNNFFQNKKINIKIQHRFSDKSWNDNTQPFKEKHLFQSHFNAEFEKDSLNKNNPKQFLIGVSHRNKCEKSIAQDIEEGTIISYTDFFIQKIILDLSLDSDFTNQDPNNGEAYFPRLIAYILVHELAHTLGIPHIRGRISLMHPCFQIHGEAEGDPLDDNLRNALFVSTGDYKDWTIMPPTLAIFNNNRDMDYSQIYFDANFDTYLNILQNNHLFWSNYKYSNAFEEYSQKSPYKWSQKSKLNPEDYTY